VASIKEDGFTNVMVLKTSRRVQNLREAGADRVALIATGHTEQHAFHLPLNTDTLIIDAIARGVEAQMPETILRLPTFPYGVSMHRRQYPGTVTIDPRAWEDFWVEIVGLLRERGLRMAYLINGHGGNHSFSIIITKFCGDRWPEMFVATSFLHTTSAELTRIESQIGGMGHACETETKLLSASAPDLVHMQRAVDEVDFVATPNYYMDWIEGGALIANPPWTDDTISGAYGAATQATAEKGRLCLEAAIDEKIGHVQEIIEQQRRREERRAEGGCRMAEIGSLSSRVMKLLVLNQLKSATPADARLHRSDDAGVSVGARPVSAVAHGGTSARGRRCNGAHARAWRVRCGVGRGSSRPAANREAKLIRSGAALRCGAGRPLA
jgi:creatinine amidohydrolase